MIKILCLLLLLPISCWALVPVEGILRGQAQLEYQQDPLRYIFPQFASQKGEEAKKVKLYHHRYQQGDYLNNSCTYYGPISYGDSWREEQARRSITSTLQYLGLDTAIKAVGTYAKELSIDESSYDHLLENLVSNYCSKNLTVFSLKTVRKSLKYYYQNPQRELLARIESSPYATEHFKNLTLTPSSRSHEFEYAIELFRDFCSWGGEISDYRMLGPYLSNRFIMSFVFENLNGHQQLFNEETGKVMLVENPQALRVNCEQLICRKVDVKNFTDKFPLSIGSSGLKTDLEKMYCQHFRYLDYKNDTIPEVKSWIKEQSLESSIFRQNLLISMMSGVPDPFFGINDYKELPFLAKSSIDERWMKWSKDVLDAFSKDLLFEESMKISVQPKSDYVSLVTQGYTLDLLITLGEMDHLLGEMDKFKMMFNIKLSKSYLLWLRKEWSEHLKNANFSGQGTLQKHLQTTLRSLFKDKEQHYLQKIWNDDLFRILSDELLLQVSKAPVSWFEQGYQDKMINIPVTFHYGLFALSYLKYRADVASDMGKLKL